jgi:hypothetical protein
MIIELLSQEHRNIERRLLSSSTSWTFSDYEVRTEIASALSPHKDPVFSDATEARFDALRAHILQLENEAEAERD